MVHEMKFARVVVAYVIKYMIGFGLIFITSFMVFAVAKDNIEKYIIKQVQTRMETGVQTIEETVDKFDLINRITCQSDSFNRLLYNGMEFPKTDIL